MLLKDDSVLGYRKLILVRIIYADELAVVRQSVDDDVVALPFILDRRLNSI